MTKRIFHCADAQGYFTQRRFEGQYVDGVEAIAEGINHFMRQVPEGAFHHGVFTRDTRFWFEHNDNFDSKFLPTPHCEFGADAWRLSVNPDYLRARCIPVFYVAKNEIDFWGKNHLTDQIKIINARVNTTTLYYFDGILREVGLNAENILGVAEINPKIAKTSLANYLRTDSKISVIPLSQYGHESIFIYDQNGERKAAAFVYEDTVQAYKNLFTYSTERMAGSGEHRDQMLTDIGSHTDVVIAGIYSDDSIKKVISGYLARGCDVVVMRDLVGGFSGQIKDVASSPELRASFQSGQLRLQNSPNYLDMARRSLQRKEQVPRP